jgi:hypothetical protein
MISLAVRWYLRYGEGDLQFLYNAVSYPNLG